MGGICGVWLHGGGPAIAEEQLTSMVRLIGYPGSGNGQACLAGTVGVGVRSHPGRINILEQQRTGEDTLIVAVHGSLYDLTAIVPTAGAREEPGSIIVRAYLAEGIEFVRRLRGDFVVAVWDGREQSLFLATDRFRVHPLYYYSDGRKVLFSSRIRAIVASSFPVDRSIQPEAIVQFVNSSIIPTPMSIYKHVRKVPAGSILSCRNGAIRVERYWDVRFDGHSLHNERELSVALRSRFEESLKTCLGTPIDRETVGAFLSGGVDSSAVTGMLTRLLRHPVKSFSIGFREERFNEIEYAKQASRFYGTDHHEYFVSPEDAFKAIPMLTEAYDEPFSNSSAIPVYYCALLAKSNGVTCLFAGDGGDELFAGNKRYADQRLFEYYRHIPGPLRMNFIEPLVLRMAALLPLEIIRKGKSYIDRANIPYSERISSYDFFRLIEPRDFLSGGFLDAVGTDYDPCETVRQQFEEAPAGDNLDRHLYLDWSLTLADNDLVKVTRMTEYAGLTVRYPFLDYPLVEFSTTVPAGIKMRGMKLRTFFKRSFRDFLPPETLKKRKHGFGLPISFWLQNDPLLRDFMTDTLTSTAHLQRGYFRKAAIEELIRQNQQDETTFYGAILWNLLNLELWHRRYHDCGN